MLLNSEGKTYESKTIAGGGLLTAIVLLFILMSYLSPTADLALMSCASMGIAVAVVRYGYRTAIIVLIASGLIAAVWPGIFFSLPFLLLFGPWPLIKAIIEKSFGKVAVVLLKQLAATVLLIVAGSIYILVFQIDLRSLLNIEAFAMLSDIAVWLILLAAAEIMFYLYDWALTLLITLYMRRLNGRV